MQGVCIPGQGGFRARHLRGLGVVAHIRPDRNEVPGRVLLAAVLRAAACWLA